MGLLDANTKRISNLEKNPIATSKPAQQSFVFDAAVGGIQNNVYSFPWRLNSAGVLVPQIAFEADQASPSTDAIFDVERFNTGSGSWESLYGSGKPKLPKTLNTYLDTTVPTITALAAGTRLRTKLTTAPPVATSGGAAVTQPGAFTAYNDGTTGASASHTLPIPAGLTAGDVVLAVVTRGDILTGLPSGWVKLGEKFSATSKSQLTIIGAQYASGMASTITYSSGTPALAITLGLRNVDLATLNKFSFSDGTEANGGGVSSPAVTASVASDMTLFFAAGYYPNSLDNYVLTAGSGPAGVAAGPTIKTVRGSTAADYALSIAKANGYAAGSGIPALPWTSTAGTGTLTGATALAGLLEVPRSGGSVGPSLIYATLTVLN